MNNNPLIPFLAIIFVVGSVLLYALPSIIAGKRNCCSFVGILLINIVFGWTFLGWWVAMIWAVTGSTIELYETPTRGYSITGREL